MPRIPLLPLAAGLSVVAMLALSACGGEDARLLPGETAREITANLDTVQQLSDEGDCIGAESAAQQVGEQIEAVEGVDRKLKRALEDGAARLEEVIVACEESATEAIAPAVIPTEPEGEEEEEEAPKKEGKKEKGARPKEEAEPETKAPAPPPKAEDEGKGPGKTPPPSEEVPEAGSDEESSGGVGPGSPAGEAE